MAVILTGVFLAVARPCQAQVAFTKVALSGETAPGTTTTFTTFSGPVINATGQVLFNANLTGGGSGLWTNPGGTLAKVATTTDIAPGTAATFSQFNNSVLNANGQVAFSAFLNAGGIGLWTNPGGTLVKIARNNDAAPGTTTTFSTFSPDAPVLNNNGQVAFGAGLNGGLGNGVWATPGGVLTKVVVTGDAAPGTTSNFVSFFGVVQAANGQVAFRSILASGSGIWSNPGGVLTKVAANGDAAPGTAFTFTNFGTPITNASGQVVFNAGTTGGASGNGIWSNPGGVLTKVVAFGDAAPGTSTTFLGGFRDSTLNDSGQVAFVANLNLTGVPSGIWTDVGGVLTKVAATNDSAPGTTGSFSTFDGPALNANGHMAFTARLTLGGSVTSTNDTGLWIRDSDGTVQLVLREGDLFDIDGDGPGTTTKTISQIAMSAAGHSDSNQFALRLTFTDGTQGIYFTPVPEPVGLLAVCGVVGLGGWLGRRHLLRRQTCGLGHAANNVTSP
jgi:hypothetical protein